MKESKIFFSLLLVFILVSCGYPYPENVYEYNGETYYLIQPKTGKGDGTWNAAIYKKKGDQENQYFIANSAAFERLGHDPQFAKFK
jgi:hypothetical protein